MYLVFGRVITKSASAVSGASFTCHQYNPGKSDDIGHGQDHMLQDACLGPYRFNILLLAL